MTVLTLLSEFDTELLLDRLDEERRQFSNADDAVIRSLVEELVRRDEYREPTPTPLASEGAGVPGFGTPHEVKPFVPLESILKAVWGYGARWHRFREPQECPKCRANLRDHDNGPPFKREVGRVENDRITEWSCPDCGATWPRRLEAENS